MFKLVYTPLNTDNLKLCVENEIKARYTAKNSYYLECPSDEVK